MKPRLAQSALLEQAIVQTELCVRSSERQRPLAQLEAPVQDAPGAPPLCPSGAQMLTLRPVPSSTDAHVQPLGQGVESHGAVQMPLDPPPTATQSMLAHWEPAPHASPNPLPVPGAQTAIAPPFPSGIGVQVRPEGQFGSGVHFWVQMGPLWGTLRQSPVPQSLAPFGHGSPVALPESIGPQSFPAPVTSSQRSGYAQS